MKQTDNNKNKRKTKTRPHPRGGGTVGNQTGPEEMLYIKKLYVLKNLNNRFWCIYNNIYM